MQRNVVLQLLIWESELLQQSKDVKKRLVLAIQELHYHTIFQLIVFFKFTIVLVWSFLLPQQIVLFHFLYLVLLCDRCKLAKAENAVLVSLLGRCQVRSKCGNLRRFNRLSFLLGTFKESLLFLDLQFSFLCQMLLEVDELIPCSVH